MSENKHGANCDCGCNDVEFDTMTLTLEDGSELTCGVISIFPVKDKQYIALLPLNDENESEEGEVYLYQFVELDEEKKAAMVSNLLVVLCADEPAQPVINSGTLNH